MKKVIFLMILAGIMISGDSVFAQNDPVSPSIIKTGVYLGLTQPLKDLPVITEREFQQMQSAASGKIMNEEFRERFFPYAASALPQGPDPVWQDKMGTTPITRDATLIFEGLATPYWPTDANGDAGLNYYMQTINCTFAIYDKTGVTVSGPSYMNQLFEGAPGSYCNNGSPIVLYDEQANRWLAAELSICGENDYILVAVSATGDPTGCWHAYSFDVDDTPDYPKLGIWRDGYYMGVSNSSGADVYVLERSKMLNGEIPLMFGFDNEWRPTTLDELNCLLPLDNDGPYAPEGDPGLFMTFNDDAIGGGSDQLWIYELNVNWVTQEANFVRTEQLDVPPFDSNFGSSYAIAQPSPGSNLDAISSVLMHRAQYRFFDTYETIVCCHTVDVDGTNHAGIRWYELRRDGATQVWSVRQSGTFAPDEHSRWCGSIALNANNEIALGYSISSNSIYPGIRFCGQSVVGYEAGLGIMDIVESTIYDGFRAQKTVSRWGDYFNMAIDPVDDHTFWFTAQYVGGDDRRTKIASIELSELTIAANFSANPTRVCTGATVMFSAECFGSPSSWSWSFPGGVPASWDGEFPPVITYYTMGTYDVSLTVSDGSGIGSTKTKNDYIFVNDVIVKFSGTPVFVDPGDPVVFSDGSQGDPSTWVWDFPGGTPASSDAQFPTPVIYNNPGTYDVSLTVSNSLGTADIKTLFGYVSVNDPIQYCFTHGNAVQEWIKAMGIPGKYIGNNSGSSGEEGYQDLMNRTVYLEPGTSYNFFLYPGFVAKSLSEFWRVWIDFNHDGDFLDAGEEILAADRKKGSFSKPINIPSGLDVITRMRISMKRGAAPTPCEVFDFGEVEDYRVYISPSVPLAPVVDFEADYTVIAPGETVQFTDLTTNNPTEWSWTFEGGDPLESSSQNPSVIYTGEGTYDVSLIATNGIGSNEIIKQDYITVSNDPPSSYCEPVAINNVDDYINSILFDDQLFESGQGDNGFTYYTSPEFLFNPGGTYSVSLEPYVLKNRNFWRIWMDFNNDGDFVDAGETLLVANNKKGTYSKSIAIPSGVSGTTRMRVSMKTGGAQSSCDDNFNGEVEDYNVIFASRATAIELVTDNGLKVEIYPNPASGDELHLEVSKSDYQIAVRIYNKAGMLIGHFETNNKHSIVDTSEYPVGIYFIEVSAGNEVVVNKFIKM